MACFVHEGRCWTGWEVVLTGLLVLVVLVVKVLGPGLGVGGFSLYYGGATLGGS